MFSVVYVHPQLHTCPVSFSRRSAGMSPCLDRCENGLATLGREDGRVQSFFFHFLFVSYFFSFVEPLYIFTEART